MKRQIMWIAAAVVLLAGLGSGARRAAADAATAVVMLGSWRPRSMASRMLSALVPHRRCSGLQHGGLSHECSASVSVGTSSMSRPVASARASRCTRTWRPCHCTLPYPLLSVPICQMQQPPSGRQMIGGLRDDPAYVLQPVGSADQRL